MPPYLARRRWDGIIYYQIMTNMKIKTIIATAFAVMALAACAQNGTQPSASASVFQPSKAQVDSVSYLLGIQFAATAQNWGFGKDYNYNELLKGYKDFINAKGNQQDPEFLEQFKINPELMNDLFTEYLDKLVSFEAAKGAEEAQAFLDKNKLEDGVAVTESGLQYKIINKGSDVVPGPDDEVNVYYIGQFINGEIFDQSPEGEAVTLPLNAVIPGWSEGIQLIGEGGKIRLFLPPELAYGASGSGPIGPNQALIFDVDLLKVISAEGDPID